MAESFDPEAPVEILADEKDVKQAFSLPPPVNSDYLPLPWKGRLGYACLNTYLRSANTPVFSSRTCRIASILEQRHPLQDPSQPFHPTKNRPDQTKPADVALGQRFVESLGLSNARDIVKMLRWNDRFGIKFMRLSSEMFPFASHAEYGYKLAPFASEALASAGRVAAELGHRLSVHPGQFSQLGSPRNEVITSSIRDLEYHAEMLNLLKLPDQLDRDAVMILHMGGTFGDKEATLNRFREVYQTLSDDIKKRLVLENDDMNWTVHDLLPICEELNIPFVLDYHHHNIHFDPDKIREGTLDIMSLYDRIKATWTRKRITQKMHYSEPTPAAITKMQRRKHSARVYMLPPCDPAMDLMIEAKDKEQAVFELMRIYKLPGFERIHSIIPHEREDENKELKVFKSAKSRRANDMNTPPVKIIPEEEVNMGGPDGRVYWPVGMEEWLRPPKRGQKRKVEQVAEIAVPRKRRRKVKNEVDTEEDEELVGEDDIVPELASDESNGPEPEQRRLGKQLENKDKASRAISAKQNGAPTRASARTRGKRLNYAEEAIVDRQKRTNQRRALKQPSVLSFLFPRRSIRKGPPSLTFSYPPTPGIPNRGLHSKKHGVVNRSRNRDDMLGTTTGMAERENGGTASGWEDDQYDSGRERGARRKKVFGYLKAANELRQAYSAQWTQKYQDSDRSAGGSLGAYPGEGAVRGDEEMILFPSYGIRRVQRNNNAHRDASSTHETRQQAPEERIDIFNDQHGCEDDNAIVDIDVRGWIYSPQRGPLNRKNRILVALARRISGIQLPNQAADEDSISSARSKPFIGGQDDMFLQNRASSILEQGREDNNTDNQQPLSPDQASFANEQLMERLYPFLTIPAANIPVTVFLFNDTNSQSRTGVTNASGQFILRASLEFVPSQVRILAGENLSATDDVKITEPTGVSLISDIDDTIKHSAISDGAKEMFRNTFVRNLDDLVINGVSEWYSKLKDMGVGIHYVSNSPWQLYPVLRKYFALAGLPPGSFHLKQYSGMLQGIFEPTSERKRPNLERIIQDFPDRQFILVGDSGEADLEIYTDLVMENPGRIIGIFIRDVTTPTSHRFFDRSITHLEGSPIRNKAANDTSNGSSDTKEVRPALPPRTYLSRSNTRADAPGVMMGNLIDLDESDENKTGPSHPSQQDGPPKPPIKPSKPVALRSANVENQGSGGGTGSSPSPRRKPLPTPPKKPSALSSSPLNNAQPATGDTYTNQTKNQAVNLFNQIPSVRKCVDNIPAINSLPLGGISSSSEPKPKSIPPPSPPPRRSTNPNLLAPTSKSSPDLLDVSSNTSPPVRNPHHLRHDELPRSNSLPPTPPLRSRTNTYPVADISQQLPPNKREEMWIRRWARAKELLDREGVPLSSWRVGSDVQDLCIRVVKEAQRKIDCNRDEKRR